MSQEVLDACLDPFLDKTLEAHEDQRVEVTPGPSIVFRSLKKLGNGLKRFPQGGKPLISYRQLFRQIINGFHSLYKIPVNTKSYQLGTSEFFFSTSFYLLSPIVIQANQYLHILNIL
jgi:hypothetical protein